MFQKIVLDLIYSGLTSPGFLSIPQSRFLRFCSNPPSTSNPQLETNAISRLLSYIGVSNGYQSRQATQDSLHLKASVAYRIE